MLKNLATLLYSYMCDSNLFCKGANILQYITSTADIWSFLEIPTFVKYH